MNENLTCTWKPEGVRDLKELASQSTLTCIHGELEANAAVECCRTRRRDSLVHSCSELRVPFPSSREAEIAHGSLSVDAEPRRGEVTKTLSVTGQQLTVYVLQLLYKLWLPITTLSLSLPLNTFSNS